MKRKFLSFFLSWNGGEGDRIKKNRKGKRMRKRCKRRGRKRKGKGKGRTKRRMRKKRKRERRLLGNSFSFFVFLCYWLPFLSFTLSSTPYYFI